MEQHPISKNSYPGTYCQVTLGKSVVRVVSTAWLFSGEKEGCCVPQATVLVTEISLITFEDITSLPMYECKQRHRYEKNCLKRDCAGTFVYVLTK